MHYAVHVPGRCERSTEQLFDFNFLASSLKFKLMLQVIGLKLENEQEENYVAIFRKVF